MVTRTVWCVWMCFRNANRYRGRIGFSRCAHQAGWSLRFVSSTVVTHAPGPAAGEMSKNEGWLVEGYSAGAVGGGGC